MLAKPSGCNLCPLRDKGQGFVPDLIAKDEEYRFIGEAPGKNEIIKGEPFIGKAGHVLKNWLLRAVPQLRLAWEQKRISLANTLRCLPPEVQGRAYPRGAEKEQAEAHCRQYDNFGKAHTVVLFGEFPQRCWFRTELEAEDASDRRLGHDVKGVAGRIGRIYEKDGRKWVFAPHPAWILRQPAIVEHGQQALKIAAGVDKLAEVDYVEWGVVMREIA